MSVKLLDHTRKIGNLLHNNSNTKVVFSDICKILSDILSASVFVISKKGKILGRSVAANAAGTELLGVSVGKRIDEDLNERLLSILSTKENVNIATLGFEPKTDVFHSVIILPIYIAGERLGTVFIYRDDNGFDIDDIIICEYGTTVVGLEMMRSEIEEKSNEENKHKMVSSAVNTLTGSEQEAMAHILDELSGNEGMLVASKVADRWNITRSVIASALRKLESAGIIATKSSGMKGTCIKVNNEFLREELQPFTGI